MIELNRTEIQTIWKRVFSLSWPVMVEQFLLTLMSTTDIIVAGYLSPATVVAVGLADLYVLIQRRIGLGLGDGAIALGSQDMGSGATANRDDAISQALLIGILLGIPLSLFGFFFSEPAIRILGAEPTVVTQSAQYLMIILLVSPATLTAWIAERAIQGTGDTLTPMYVNGITSGLNIIGTVGLAFGIGPLPQLSIIGIGLATAGAEVLTALSFVLLIYSSRTTLEFAQPTNVTITRQLIRISAPRIAGGLTIVIVLFPFNAILLSFGTEVNDAYQIGRRLYEQVVAPLSRGYATSASIIVGQAIGQNDPDDAYTNGLVTTTLGLLTIGGLSLVLFAGANVFAHVFTRDPATLEYATDFVRVYAVAAVFIGGYLPFAGALRGGSETLAPFIALLTGSVGLLLGVSYVFGVQFGYGLIAVYVAIVSDFAWRMLFVAGVYARRNWLDRANVLMGDRGSQGIRSSGGGN